jgi:hypothetical protein
MRHVKNIEFSNIEIACAALDQRPAFWMNEVSGIDLFRIKTNNVAASTFHAENVSDFRVFGSRIIKDISEASISSRDF